MKYTAGCHCGKVRIEFVGTIDSALECNCSICAKKGSLLWFVPRDAMRVTSDKTHIGTYTFNKHVIHHHFCTHCGIHPYAEGKDPQGNRMAAINLRCVDDLDLSKVPVKQFNGKAL